MSSPVGPFISVLVPFFWRRQAYLEDFLRHVDALDYEQFEILILSNRPVETTLPRNTEVVVTEAKSQGEKYDVGIKISKGSICAFVGDDTYPSPSWLSNAARHFDDPIVIAVGGPGVTPPDDSPLQKGSGFIYESPLGTGPTRFRHKPSKERLSDDLPATNLFIRKESLLEVGGVGISYRSGEDTYLCSKLKRLGKKMIYAPDVVIFHHHRNLLRGHLRQMWNAGLHRGFFAKRFGSNSLKPMYFLPSTILILLPFLVYLSIMVPMFGAGLVLLVILLSLEEAGRFYLRVKSFSVALMVPVGFWLSHLTYGVAFIRGLSLDSDSSLFHSE